MTISIWRYSHLTLAISSSLFILVAALTGIILAIEPISNQLEPYAIHELEKQSLSSTISLLEENFNEVISLKIDDNHFVKASVVTKDGDSKTLYINPFTGEEIFGQFDKKPIYRWATNLHRSLFLKSTGRFIVGFFSLLLALITITGGILIVKRQGGVQQLFSKIIKENTAQYYHITIGRLAFIPIIIITSSGVYLSLEKFSIIPESTITHNYNLPTKDVTPLKKVSNFELFKNTHLDEIISLEFPFSDDEEDYFLLKTFQKEYLIHQYTGTIISNQHLSTTSILSKWSLLLHTGRGTIIWSIILLLSCVSILFFIFSGFAISLRRIRKNTEIVKNKYAKDKAEFVLLVGSETGTTTLFANALYQGLIDNNKLVYIDHLNNYTSYKNCNYLLILTATYGDGEAPINASKFITQFQRNSPNNTIEYAVVGFGSLAYPKYCQFAIEINSILKKQQNFKELLPLYKIHNQSFQKFKTWGILLENQLNLSILLKQVQQKSKKTQQFSVIETSSVNQDNTYLIRLKPTKKLKFNSGDLLAIRPEEDHVERLYSIGKINNEILLSIKKHPHGVCSNALLDLQQNQVLTATIKINSGFQLPRKKEVILIANGTGIAPFLGMIHQTSTRIHLFFGVKSNASLQLYKPHLNRLTQSQLHVALSQQKKEYVQDLIAKEPQLIANTLKNGGTIMVCGSIAMMQGVLSVLEEITLQELNCSLQKFKKSKQLKTDCY